MACYQCGTQFSFFNKEHGCKNCGFAFCGKCLTHKVNIPKLGNELGKVCFSCHKKLTNPTAVNENSGRISPPENFKRRLAAAKKADNPPPSSSKTHSGKAPSATADLEERLKALKGTPAAPPPSHQDLQKRLCDLKGISHESDVRTNKPFVMPPPKSEADQIADLLRQTRERQEIDDRAAGRQPDEDATAGFSASSGGEDNVEDYIKKMAAEADREAKEAIAGLQKDKEIADRLKKIKNESRTADHNAVQEDSESDDEEAKTQKLIKQLVAENELDERLGGTCPQFNAAKASDEEEEYPWCCICNEDADVRCRGCDNDLYCRRCYREGHSREDFRDHKTMPFTQKN